MTSWRRVAAAVLLTSGVFDSDSRKQICKAYVTTLIHCENSINIHEAYIRHDFAMNRVIICEQRQNSLQDFKLQVQRVLDMIMQSFQDGRDGLVGDCVVRDKLLETAEGYGLQLRILSSARQEKRLKHVIALGQLCTFALIIKLINKPSAGSKILN